MSTHFHRSEEGNSKGETKNLISIVLDVGASQNGLESIFLNHQSKKKKKKNVTLYVHCDPE